MPLMIAPGGEVADVPADQVRHYASRGAKPFGAGTEIGQRGEGREDAYAMDELGTGTQPLMDPVDFAAGFIPKGGQVLGNVARATPGAVRGTLGAIREGAEFLGDRLARLRPSSMAGRGLAPALRAGAKMLPGVNAEAAEATLAQLSGGAQTVGRGIAQPVGATVGGEAQGVGASVFGRTPANPANAAIEAASGPSEAARRAVARLDEMAPEPAPAIPEAPAPQTPKDRIAAMTPVDEGADEATKRAHRIDLEFALSEAKGMAESSKKAIREALGHGPEPKPARPSLKVVEGGGQAPTRPSATGPEAVPATRPSAQRDPAPELLAKPRPEGWDKPFSRHEHGVWSESAQAKVAIETMGQNHLIASMEQRARELAKFGDKAATRSPVKWSELQALKKELAWRAEHGGVTAQGRRAGQAN